MRLTSHPLARLETSIPNTVAIGTSPDTVALVRYAIWKYVGRYAVTEKSPMPMIAERATPAAIVRSAKNRSGTIGSVTRSSMAKKAAKPIAETTKATTAADAAAGSPTHVTASTSATNASVKAIAPPRSKRRRAPGSMCGIANRARPSAARPNGMLIQNTQGQPQ